MDLFIKFKMNVINTDFLMALPEYRNGGMIIDMNIIELIDNDFSKSHHDISSDIIIEWRALTVCIIEILKDKINTKLNKNFHMGQILEGGTWAIGREMSKKRFGASPLMIISNGTIM